MTTAMNSFTRLNHDACYSAGVHSETNSSRAWCRTLNDQRRADLIAAGDAWTQDGRMGYANPMAAAKAAASLEAHAENDRRARVALVA